VQGQAQQLKLASLGRLTANIAHEIRNPLSAISHATELLQEEPNLSATQTRLLEARWPLLRQGGRLLYCTCSLFKAEGQDRIDAFLQRQGGAGRAAVLPSPGYLLPLTDNAGGGARPVGVVAPDGFYYALLEKASR
jgi:16S rRNA C967 or C1407 C5-methylase (RsmB/RsmF family)